MGLTLKGLRRFCRGLRIVLRLRGGLADPRLCSCHPGLRPKPTPAFGGFASPDCPGSLRPKGVGWQRPAKADAAYALPLRPWLGALHSAKLERLVQSRELAVARGTKLA